MIEGVKQMIDDLGLLENDRGRRNRGEESHGHKYYWNYIIKVCNVTKVELYIKWNVTDPL